MSSIRAATGKFSVREVWMYHAELVQVYTLPWCGRSWFNGHPSLSLYALGNVCVGVPLWTSQLVGFEPQGDTHSFLDLK